MSDSDADGSIDNLWQYSCLFTPRCFSKMNDQRPRSPSLGKSPDSLPRSPLLERIQSIQKQQNLLNSFAKEENAIPDSLSVCKWMGVIHRSKTSSIYLLWLGSSCFTHLPTPFPPFLFPLLRVLIWITTNWSRTWRSTSTLAILVWIWRLDNAVESAEFYYKDVLLTDVLLEIDAYKQLPASVYSMLYSVATACKDDISSLRAWELLITLLTRHSVDQESFLLCIPKAEELCNVWDQFGTYESLMLWEGYATNGAMDLSLLIQNHPELRNEIVPDGSIKSILYSSFPLIQFRNYLQFLLSCFTVLREDKCHCVGLPNA